MKTPDRLPSESILHGFIFALFCFGCLVVLTSMCRATEIFQLDAWQCVDYEIPYDDPDEQFFCVHMAFAPEAVEGYETEIILTERWGDCTWLHFGGRIGTDPETGAGIYAYYWQAFITGDWRPRTIERQYATGHFWILLERPRQSPADTIL